MMMPTGQLLTLMFTCLRFKKSLLINMELQLNYQKRKLDKNNIREKFSDEEDCKGTKKSC